MLFGEQVEGLSFSNNFRQVVRQFVDFRTSFRTSRIRTSDQSPFLMPKFLMLCVTQALLSSEHATSKDIILDCNLKWQTAKPGDKEWTEGMLG